MKFKNYCVVIMGFTKNVTIEIEKIADNKPNILDAKGIVIATFSSTLTISELNEWFKINDRSFFVFDLNPKLSAYHITKEDIHNGLFGFLEKMNDDILDDKAKNIMNAIEDAKILQEKFKKDKNKTNFIDLKRKSKKLSELEISQMTDKQRQSAMNEIIEKGVENLTEYDKKILPLLAK